MRKHRLHNAIAILAPTLGVIALVVLAVSCTQPKQPTPAAAPPDDPPSKLSAVDANAMFSTAGIVGSRHDFTAVGGAGVDLCTPCHTPHLSIQEPPAFDRRPASGQRLRPYSAVGVELDDSSLLCLSCHDGVVAQDVYRSGHSARSLQLGSAWAGPGSLTSHPIGVKYPIGEPTYRSPDAVTADGRIKLPGGRIQCISCHDPHNTARSDAMLVRSNQGSRLCLACHRL